MECKHLDGNYCEKIMHMIDSGYAEKAHCSDCKYFEEKNE